MAEDISRVVLIGRLIKDAELKSIASGQAVTKFTIAVNRRKKSGDQWGDEASFFDVVLWGQRGEALHQYLLKGKQVCVDGELRQDRWQHDGQSRSRVEIVASNIQLLGGGSGGGSGSSGGSGGGGGPSGYGNSGGSQGDSRAPRGGSQAPAEDGFADDIPF
ncbi:MAG: single-stranded DNA-binding protein [Treponema sp.]|jgi:single-strand DNA-binding protein|nr:single-stranded DNA-binding protein [Treponema sp.]